MSDPPKIDLQLVLLTKNENRKSHRHSKLQIDLKMADTDGDGKVKAHQLVPKSKQGMACCFDDSVPLNLSAMSGRGSPFGEILKDLCCSGARGSVVIVGSYDSGAELPGMQLPQTK